MSTATKTVRYTFDDFCAIVKDGEKADLIDGVIYMASPDNTDANELFVWLVGVIYMFVKRKDLGRVFGERVAFRLDKYNGPEPDIGFVRKRRLDRIRRGFIKGGPDLAVEIVSPESIRRDYVEKRRQYQRAGVREYWIIDEMKKKVILLRLNKEGKYREVKPRKGILFSRVLKGFWLDPAWLWQQPLPDQIDTVQQILAE